MANKNLTVKNLHLTVISSTSSLKGLSRPADLATFESNHTDMEPQEIQNKRSQGGLWAGIIIAIVGAIFLLDNLNVNVPDWVIGWHTFVLAAGLIIGYNHNFRGNKWLIFTLVGGLFTLESLTEYISDFNYDLGFNLDKLTWPLALMAVGSVLIFRSKNVRNRL